MTIPVANAAHAGQRHGFVEDGDHLSSHCGAEPASRMPQLRTGSLRRQVGAQKPGKGDRGEPQIPPDWGSLFWKDLGVGSTGAMLGNGPGCGARRSCA